MDGTRDIIKAKPTKRSNPISMENTAHHQDMARGRVNRLIPRRVALIQWTLNRLKRVLRINPPLKALRNAAGVPHLSEAADFTATAMVKIKVREHPKIKAPDIHRPPIAMKLFYAQRFLLRMLPVVVPLRIRLGMVPYPVKEQPVCAIGGLMWIA